MPGAGGKFSGDRGAQCFDETPLQNIRIFAGRELAPARSITSGTTASISLLSTVGSR